MFSVLLSVITVRVSRAFVTHLPRMIPHQTRFFRQRTYQIIGIVFLVVLVSCDTAQGASLPHKSMPRRYVPLSSTIPALSGTDWTTYHYDNARTGDPATSLIPSNFYLPGQRNWTMQCTRNHWSLVTASLSPPWGIASTPLMLARGRCNGIPILGIPFPCQR